MKKWPFDQNENVAALTTKNVMQNNYPVLAVTHYYDDDSWGFYCGTTDDPEDYMVVSMKEITDLDSTLFTISYLKPGMGAGRKNLESEWETFKEEQDAD
ncbi:MAG: hypothetical protein JW982_08500 [Spirochaetes bacterium]|nr:hypothetical protein [Spirochaetota bacterium]